MRRRHRGSAARSARPARRHDPDHVGGSKSVFAEVSGFPETGVRPGNTGAPCSGSQIVQGAAQRHGAAAWCPPLPAPPSVSSDRYRAACCPPSCAGPLAGPHGPPACRCAAVPLPSIFGKLFGHALTVRASACAARIARTNRAAGQNEGRGARGRCAGPVRAAGARGRYPVHTRRGHSSLSTTYFRPPPPPPRPPSPPPPPRMRGKGSGRRAGAGARC